MIIEETTVTKLTTPNNYDLSVDTETTIHPTSATQMTLIDSSTRVDNNHMYQSTLSHDMITTLSTSGYLSSIQNELGESTDLKPTLSQDTLTSASGTSPVLSIAMTTTKQPLAVDKQVRLIRLITTDYSAEVSISQLEDRQKWSSQSPRNQKQSYIVSSIPSCHGYISETASSINKNLKQKPNIPDVDIDSLSYPYAYSCTNSSDTYVIPYLSGLNAKDLTLSDSEQVGGRASDSNMGGLIMYLLPVSKMDLHMRVKDIRQQGYNYACLALDICGYTVIVTQSDDTTIFYLVVRPTGSNTTYEGVHLELVCSHALLILLDENKWIYGVEGPITVSDAISLVQVNDYNYSAVYPTESYCTVRILKSFWGYFANKSILEKLR